MRAILGACALILGALAFLVFWGSAVAWDDKLLGVEIGRASCRERVWRYV